MVKGDYPTIEVTATETNENVFYWLDKLGLKYKKVNEEFAVGDYRIGDHYVERKTVVDAVGSIVSGRLNNQAFDLSCALEASWLIIVGNPAIDLQNTGFALDSFVAAISSIAMRKAGNGLMGHINVIMVYSEMEFVLWLKHIQKRAYDFTPREPLAEKIEKFSRDPVYSLPFLVQAIPGINKILAHNLLVHFDSVETLVNANITSLEKVPKIGKKRATFIYNHIRIRYSNVRFNR